MPGRRGSVRHSSALLAAVLVLCTLLLGAPIARAGCVGPVLAVGEEQPTGAEPSPALVRVARTAPLTVTGIWFHSGCEDTVSYAGCVRAPAADPEAPLRRVALMLEQNGRTWQLGVADAGDRSTRYAIRWQVSLPADVAAGPATLVADTARRSIDIG